MFSQPPILNDFVYPIPCCDSKINLNTILNIFQRGNCQQVAIFQENGNWGLIDSVDLLSLITEVHLNQKTVASGHFRSSMPQTKNGFDSQLSLIVKPAVVYQSDIRLDEFLSQTKGSLECDRQKYLLVDKLGKLQGKLDKNKILEYLALQYKPNRGDRCQSLVRSNFALLDSIPLPLKIETTSGKDLYFNTCWQELIIGDRRLQQQLPERAIASWWIERVKTPDGDNSRKAQSRQELECFSDRDSILSSFLSRSQLGLKTDVNSINEDQHSSSRSQTGEQNKNWKYIRIPLTEINREYQLVLAIEATSQTSLPLVANKLLATLTHELKSPLTGIVGLSNLLEAQKLGQLNQRQTRYVELIHNSGQKMVSIINDLIKLTTLSSECCIESESVDLEPLCRQVYQQLCDQLQSLNTRDLEVDNSGELELEIEQNSTAIAPKSHLSCILFHLMMEAVEFAKSPERLKIKISSLSGSIAITIFSTLTAISPDKANHNISSSLRLAIVEYLTELIQGNFYSDRYDDRCQFTLLLPTARLGQISSQPATVSITDKTAKSNLTILCLCPEAEAIGDRADCDNSLNLDLKSFLDGSKHSNYRHRIIEADGLEQAHTLARIWQLDVIILEGHQLSNPIKYLQLLQTSEYLSAVPLITLDNETTQAANQIKGLSVYPCLVPAEHRRIEDLMEVIQIAAG